MATIALSGTQTIVNSKVEDDCKPELKPESKPEPECCCKTYNVVLHFH